MKLKPIVRGIISYIPGLLPYLKKKIGNRRYGGTDSARYCYSIWMRHLIYLNNNFGKKSLKNIAEIGPGDSLGMGIMALITGAEKYFVLDMKKYINPEKNLQVFNELSELFINKENIPGDEEFPLIQPKLDDYKFPEYLFEGNYDKLIDSNRLDEIRKVIESELCNEIGIKYIIPWDKNFDLLYNNIDLLFTQAVMEHINNLDEAYSIMYRILSPGGMISHEIDYSSHETHERWNGHLNYGKFLWYIIMHGRPYDINRLPHSIHIELIKKNGFESVIDNVTKDNSNSFIIRNSKIKSIFKEEDYTIQNALIQAVKPNI